MVFAAFTGSIDERHAHKPGIITKDGVLYHFYCAVAPAGRPEMGDVVVREMRGITLAVSDGSVPGATGR